MTGPNEITGDDPAPLPDSAFLAQNFPNPFNTATTIAFGLKEKGHVSLKIFDASGRLIRTLVEETRTVGKYETVWNGLDDTGVKISSGVYFYRLTTNEFEKTRKMILLR